MSMQTKHTKGPWEVIHIETEEIENGLSHTFKVINNDTEHSNEKGIATANLIESAPELLEACKALVAANKKMARWIVQHEHGKQEFTGMEAHMQGYNAINKAKGL